MSLQIWLPLTKDLRQQGLSDVTVTNNGATFNSAGKLGGCYNFDGTNDNLSYTPNVDGLETLSIAFWTCPTAATPSGTFFSIERDTYWQITFYNNNVAIRDNSVGYSGTRKNFSTGTYIANEWTHVVVTYNKGILKIYRDGSLLSTNSIGGTKLNTGINNARVGSAVQSGYYYAGKLNDVRIYDHCLSEMEVKQLSQGLVLHYPLSDNSIQQLNNCYTNPTFNSSSASGGWSHWGGTGHKGTYGQNTDSNYIYREGQSYSHWVANEEDATKNYLVYQSPAFEGGQRSLQCICKEENGLPINEAIVFPDWNARSGGTVTGKWTSIISLGNGFYYCRCENIQQDGSNDLIGFYVRPGYKVYFSEAYVENNRECCSDIFYPANITYDISGFCNNGSIYAYDTNGTIEISNNTPKYAVSTYINSDNNITNTASGTQYIYGNCELTAPQYLTVAFWCKPIAGYGNITGQGQFSLTKNVIGASAGEDYSTCPMNHRDSCIDMCTSNGVHKTVNITFTANEWHHYVVVYDGRYGRVYKDGVATGQTLDMGSVLPLKDMKGAVIGFSKAGGVWRSNKSYYSDFRIYATALSADDVKSLYQNCATIDPDGTIRGQIRS